MEIETKTYDSSIVVSGTVDILRPENIREFLQHAEVELEVNDDIRQIIFDLSKCKSISTAALPFLCHAKSDYSQLNCQFAIVGNQKIYGVIVAQALERVIPVYASLDDLVVRVEETKVSKSHQFLNTLLESVIHTLKISFQSEVKITDKKQIDDVTAIPSFQIGAAAGILSAHFNGNLVVGFKTQDFLAAMSRFLSRKFTEVTPVIRDGAAELLNVIIGQTKIKLNQKGFDIQQVIPTVISGDNVDIGPMTNQSAILISFQVEFGEFFIILMASNRKRR